MTLGTRQRWLVLIVLLTAALTAAAWVREDDDVVVIEAVDTTAGGETVRATRTPADAGARSAVAAEQVRLEKLRERDAAGVSGDAFAPRSWQRPAAKPQAGDVVAAPPPPPPSAPPLPFAYMGRLLDEDTSAVFLMQGDRSLIARQGETIDATYRIEEIAGTRLTFTHLPTGIRQTLSFGEPQ
jgi:hypothetical protein